jgi:hypothetical protein
MAVLFTILSVLAVVLLVGALIVFLIRIVRVLDRVGGTPTSYLAKIRFGVRAIEVETGHLPVEATALNEQLAKIAGGLRAVDDKLVATAGAAAQQGEGGFDV